MNRRSSIGSAICVLAAILALAGCQEPMPYPQFSEMPYPSATALLGQHHIVGSSVSNSPIMTQIFGQGPDVILILATIHGDEPAGTPLLRSLAKHIRSHLELINGRTIVLLPVANPDAFARNTRHNANGVDLNRNFSAANRINTATTGRSPLSEPEARAIAQIIEQYKPRRTVSLHQRRNRRPGCIDYDGPAREIARRMAQYCDLPVNKLGAMPGSLGSYAGLTLRIPIITFEMQTADSQLTPQALWRKYGKALLAAITYPINPE